MHSTDVVSTYYGFAVDSSEKIYIGKNSAIEVYENGTQIKTINSMSSRYYTFAIENDNMLMATAEKLYILDLEGNIISEKDVNTSQTMRALESVTDYEVNGNVYSFDKSFGRVTISVNNRIMYQTPLWEQLLKISLVCIYILFFIFTSTFVVWKRKLGDGSRIA